MSEYKDDLIHSEICYVHFIRTCIGRGPPRILIVFFYNLNRKKSYGQGLGSDDGLPILGQRSMGPFINNTSIF